MARHFILGLCLSTAVPLLAGDIHGKVDSKGMRDGADAVVYVTGSAGKTSSALGPHATMDQRNLTFVPRVLAVPVGTTVDFQNSDSVTHNVFTPTACAGRFNLGTWPKGQSKSYTFSKECFATLLCLIHPEMEGYVAALPTPYFAVTAADGSYTIAGLADGSYAVKVWHPKLKGAEKSVTVHGATTVDWELSK